MFRDEIKEGAVFLADAHVNKSRDNFYTFLKKIESGKIKTPQLFLMGDIFDLLVGGVSYTVKENAKYIEIINKISKKIEVVYFEGNHDFNLSDIFPFANIVEYGAQPKVYKYKKHNILLLHGDKMTTFSYKIYTKIIRNRTIIKLLNFLDTSLDGKISKMILSSGYKKNICKKIVDFKKIIKKRLKLLCVKNIDVIVEGHFHQDVEFEFENKKYINLSSFACNKSFFIVQSHNKFLKEVYTD